MTIHIPDEVRKAALAELNNAFLGSMEDKMAAVLTAALQAWRKAGFVLVPFHGAHSWGKSREHGTLDYNGRLTLQGVTEGQYEEWREFLDALRTEPRT
jgi:hypothetical protein